MILLACRSDEKFRTQQKPMKSQICHLKWKPVAGVGIPHRFTEKNHDNPKIL